MSETVASLPEMAAMLSRQMQREPDRVSALFALTYVAHFNLFRLAYGTLTFDDKKRLYEKYLTLFPEEERFDTDFVLQSLRQIATKTGILTVAELGGYQGELAQHMYAQYPHLHWTSFDIIPHKIPKKLSPFFTEHVLNKELWETDIDLSHVDAFVSMHTLEHFSDDEVAKLFKYLKRWKVPRLIMQLPVQPGGQTWKNYYGAHVLKMGSNQIKVQLAPEYRLMAEVPKGLHVWEGWCGFFEYKAC